MSVPLNKLLETVYPRGAICLGCRRWSGGKLLCDACAKRLEKTALRENLCAICGSPLDSPRGCRMCGVLGGLEARSAWVHSGVARQLVHRLKYGGVTDAAIVLAEGVAEAARGLHLPPDTVVTWTAMPKARWMDRYFDHAEVLARRTASLLKLPVMPLLEQRERGRHQVGLKREERLRNLRSAFQCLPGVQGTVLLVDDVLTTGATARACADCLEKGGAEQVLVVTATRSVPGFHEEKEIG